MICFPKLRTSSLHWNALTHYCTVRRVAHLISHGAALHIEHDTFDRFITRLGSIFCSTVEPFPISDSKSDVYAWREAVRLGNCSLYCRLKHTPTYQVGLIGDLHMHCRINSLYMDPCYKNNCCLLVVKISAVSGL